MRGPEIGDQTDIWRGFDGLQGRKPSEINTHGPPGRSMVKGGGRAPAARRRVSVRLGRRREDQAEGVAPPFERGGFGSEAE